MAYPSVTQVLNPWISFDGAGNRVNDGAWRGTQIHQYCSSIARGLYTPKPLPEHEGYVESFKQWKKLMVRQVLLAETVLTCDCFGFTGTPDLLVVVGEKGEKWLVDIKTPITQANSWLLQVSAYSHLIEKHSEFSKPDQCGSLQLSPAGKMATFRQYDATAQAFAVFLGGLQIWKWINR